MTETKDTAARFVTAFNAHDEKTLNELHASDIKFSAPGGFKATNAHEATAYATRWLKGFPNGKMTVRNEIVSAPWVVQEVTMEGTNTGSLEGPMGTIQPTHKHVVGKGVQVLKIENGKITEARIYFDMVDQLTQLGLMPVPATV
ncbi:MAG TPA: ester cyclase [Candidatus Acidoferrum sp.]|jgi:predicted ester cyclase|nr:ester cyclase [Candidatus Acidoferrum sp.]